MVTRLAELTCVRTLAVGESGHLDTIQLKIEQIGGNIYKRTQIQKKRKYKCELKKWRNTTNIDKFKLTHGYELKLAKLAENKIKKWTTGLAQ